MRRARSPRPRRAPRAGTGTSVRAVDARQNSSAGGLLNWFYTSDRILYGSDKFYVEITDDKPTPGR
jgi:hypothetical protein